jgi:hypothetical protein
MLKIDRENRALEPILAQTLKEAGIEERADLQDLIENNSKAFFDEIDLENAVLLGTEVKPSDRVGDRIDLLALADDGTVIVIELKRGSEKLHLLQGISYAAMIAKWQPDQFVELNQKLNQNRELELEDGAKINSAQRIVLVADAFEYEVLTTAEWLFETYGLDILCIRLEVARDRDAEYLTCEQVYPAPALEDQAVRRGEKRISHRESRPPPSPDEILASIANDDVADFLAEQRTKVHFDEKNKPLKYVVRSRVEWSISIHKRFASVWQYRRFSEDLEFWKQRLTNRETVAEKENGRALGFRLESRPDFDAFLDAYAKASTFEWKSKPRGL